MAELGKKNKLKVVKLVDFGAYLDGENLGEILLPKRYTPENCNPDDIISVFIYKDSEDKVIATTEKPFTEINQCALLRVKDISTVGVFMDWGLMKDLLVPYREQAGEMKIGRSYIVYTYLDNESERIVGSTKLNKYLDNTFPDYTEGQEVELLIAEKTDIGYKAIINNLHWGLLYKSEVFKELLYGEKVKGYIRKVRKDDKIDLTLEKTGFSKVNNASDKILNELKINNGFIPLNDKSPADKIYQKFGFSKKTFKMTIGSLYKDKKIQIKGDGIYINK